MGLGGQQAWIAGRVREAGHLSVVAQGVWAGPYYRDPDLLGARKARPGFLRECPQGHLL